MKNDEAVAIMLPCDHQGNPSSYIVGQHGVTKIVREDQNFGDHGISMMHVFKGDDCVLSAPVKQVAFIEWKE